MYDIACVDHTYVYYSACHHVCSHSVKDMDEALEAALPTETPVQKIGFFGPRDEYLYNISSVETLSLWHIQKVFSSRRFLNS